MTRYAAAFALLLFSLAATAQDEDVDPTLPEAEDGAEIIYQKITELEFGTAEVNAAISKPEGTLTVERTRAVFHPMIQPREDFDQEMRESVSLVR